MILEDAMPYIAKPIDIDQVMITTFESLVEWNSIKITFVCRGMKQGDSQTEGFC